ncbi:hypothetical protein Droror1_Dr00010541 [Drosera rotundifolia]
MPPRQPNPHSPMAMAAAPSLLLLLLLNLIFQSQSSLTLTLLKSCLTHHNITNITFHTDPNHHALLHFSLQNLRLSSSGYPKPAAIIVPRRGDEVAGAVGCCRAAGVGVRVRSGGHSYEGLSFTSGIGENGEFVIVDMMGLNRVVVDLESETAWVEGGATLGELYNEIGKVTDVHGFPAGISPTVGCSGQILGGGIGLLSRKYGLAADNVVDALIVDAEGRVLDCEGMGEDVFWAIRGGGGGVWGVVIGWRIKLVGVPKVVTSFIVSRGGGRDRVGDDLVRKWQVVAPYLEDDMHLSVLIGAGFGKAESERNEVSAMFKGFYLGPRKESLSFLSRSFPELELAEEECIESSWIESVLFFSGLGNGSNISDLQDRYLQDKSNFKVKSDYVKEPISDEGLRLMFDELEKEPKGFVILDPNGGAMHRFSSDSIAFPHREGNLFNIHYMVTWNHESNANSDDYLRWIRDFYDVMTPYVSSSPRTAHVNYIDLDLGVMDWSNITDFDNAVEEARVWGEKYFLGNYDRLVRAKTLIDPYNVFRHEQSIPPMSTVLQYNNRNDRTWDLFVESLGAKSPS